jgi:hypothetical protein
MIKTLNQPQNKFHEAMIDSFPEAWGRKDKKTQVIDPRYTASTCYKEMLLYREPYTSTK